MTDKRRFPATRPARDGIDGAPGQQGPPGLPLTARGQWNQGQYYVGDSVVWNDINYVAQVTFLSSTSPDTDLNWLRFTGPDGPQGPQGLPGEVSAQQLADAIATTSANTNAIALLPDDADLPTMRAKINELIQALKR